VGCQSTKSFLVGLAVAAFGMNLIWELTQVFAFSSLDEASAFEVTALPSQVSGD